MPARKDTEHPALSALKAAGEDGYLDCVKSGGRGEPCGWCSHCKLAEAIPALKALIAERDALRAALEDVLERFPGEDWAKRCEDIGRARAALAKGDA